MTEKELDNLLFSIKYRKLLYSAGYWIHVWVARETTYYDCDIDMFELTLRAIFSAVVMILIDNEDVCMYRELDYVIISLCM